MMSAPASRYWRWIASITAGCVTFSRSLCPFEVFGPLLKSCPAERGFVQFVALDYGPHGNRRGMRIRSFSRASTSMYRHDYLCLSVPERPAGAANVEGRAMSGHHIGNRLFQQAMTGPPP